MVSEVPENDDEDVVDIVLKLLRIKVLAFLLHPQINMWTSYLDVLTDGAKVEEHRGIRFDIWAS